MAENFQLQMLANFLKSIGQYIVGMETFVLHLYVTGHKQKGNIMMNQFKKNYLQH